MAKPGQGSLASTVSRWDETTLLEQLSEQQEELVGSMLRLAAQSEAISQQNARLAQELAGSLDRVQEVHHRVRNHLQAVTGLLSAQEMLEGSPTARLALRQSVARLTSIAAIHDLLARDPRSGELRLEELTRQLGQHLLEQVGATGRIELRAEVGPIALGTKEGTAFVLILAELLSNAIEHGFGREERGEIRVGMKQEGERAMLVISDSGRGLPEALQARVGKTMGMRLVQRLVERDLKGSIRVESGEGGRGACFRIEFPLREGVTTSGRA